MFGNVFLHRIDGDGLVDGATGTGILTAAVAHTTADSGEGVLAFDELQCLAVFALCGFLQVALHGDMRRTGGLARSRARRIAVDAVLVAVVFVPFVFAPFGGIRQLLLRIGLLAVFGAELLSKADSTGRTVFHTAAACHAVLRFHFSYICTTREVRRIEQL